MNLQVKLLHPDAKLPTKAYPFDAGWDLYSVEDVDIKPGETVKVPTGIAISPPGKYNVSLLWDRSSLGSKGIHRLAGVIDSSYRGEILVCLTNLNTYPLFSILQILFCSFRMDNRKVVAQDEMLYIGTRLEKVMQEQTYHIKKGDKIAQIVIHDFVPCEVELSTELSETERNTQGFGSTGT